MATTKVTVKKSNSALKRNRQSLKREIRNTRIVSRLKTKEKKLRLACDAGANDVKSLYQSFALILDKAAKQGVIHKNSASRKKSRLNAYCLATAKPSANSKTTNTIKKKRTLIAKKSISKKSSSKKS